MKFGRFILAVIVVFVFVTAFDWAFHGVLLKDMYAATSDLWRPESQMKNYLSWMTAGHALFALMFCCLFVPGYKGKGVLEGIRYGFYIALLLAAGHLIMFSVQPIPMNLIAYWIGGSVVELVIAGAILAGIYKA